MTPAEELAEVRAELGRMIFRARHYIACGDGDQGVPMSCNLLLRVAREALGVLDRHFPASAPAYCGECESEDSQPVDWPCPEVKSVLRAWQP